MEHNEEAIQSCDIWNAKWDLLKFAFDTVHLLRSRLIECWKRTWQLGQYRCTCMCIHEPCKTVSQHNPSSVHGHSLLCWGTFKRCSLIVLMNWFRKIGRIAETWLFVWYWTSMQIVAEKCGSFFLLQKLHWNDWKRDNKQLFDSSKLHFKSWGESWEVGIVARLWNEVADKTHARIIVTICWLQLWQSWRVCEEYKRQVRKWQHQSNVVFMCWARYNSDKVLLIFCSATTF